MLVDPALSRNRQGAILRSSERGEPDTLLTAVVTAAVVAVVELIVRQTVVTLLPRLVSG
jgi:hypothetical protein